MSIQKVTFSEWQNFWIDKGFYQSSDGNPSPKPPGALSRIMNVGKYFVLVADYSNLELSNIQGSEQLLGITPAEFVEGKLNFLIGLLHPDDVEKVMGLALHYFKFIEQFPIEKRLDFKGTINMRLKNAKGDYIPVLEQVVPLNLTEDGTPRSFLKYFSDVSHLPYSEEIVLAILGDSNEDQQRFYTFNIADKTTEQTEDFSKREVEILVMMSEGLTTKEISAKLNVSPFTINKHRENIMRKSGCKNIAEVISFAWWNGYLKKR